MSWALSARVFDHPPAMTAMASAAIRPLGPALVKVYGEVVHAWAAMVDVIHPRSLKMHAKY